MMGVGIYWDNYFDEDKELYYKDADRRALADQIASHAFSIEALSSTLLQYAKQGLSFAHGNLPNCPDFVSFRRDLISLE